MGLAARRRPPTGLELELGSPVGPYWIARRLAPNCYDADDVRSGAYVTIELGGEEDSQLIDVRFARASAMLERLEHRGVARIVQHGRLANGRPWVASKRPVGTALTDVLAERRLSVAQARSLVRASARVLAHAHARQIVHGALRPHHLVLADVGDGISISGWAWLRSPGIPTFGDPSGASVYAAPEQQVGAAIDGRADVYALGAIAYRALTGVFPDVARDLVDARDPLGAVIDRMLAADPRDRASAASVVVDLDAA